MLGAIETMRRTSADTVTLRPVSSVTTRAGTLCVAHTAGASAANTSAAQVSAAHLSSASTGTTAEKSLLPRVRFKRLQLKKPHEKNGAFRHALSREGYWLSSGSGRFPD